MKLARFSVDGGSARLGRVDGDRVTDLSAEFGTSLKALLPDLPPLRERLLAQEGETYAWTTSPCWPRSTSRRSTWASE